MINRRHLRVKVMQILYALNIAGSGDIDAGYIQLRENIDKMYELYLIHLGILAAIRRKAESIYIKSEKLYFKNRLKTLVSPNVKNNRLLRNIDQALDDHPGIAEYWDEHSEMLERLWNELIRKKLYKKYSGIDRPTFEDDKGFVKDMFRDIIAPHEVLYEFYTGASLGWADDYPSVNTRIMQHLAAMKPNISFAPDRLFKFPSDWDYALLLLKKSFERSGELAVIIDEHTPNWDYDRIMPIDRTLLIMALTEFLDFPSIPTRVTINEYIEISKDYATEKSAFFINGVLDKLLKKFTAENLIHKSGKGLR